MYRSLIVDAAERLFAERGYDRTKIHDIAAESGVSLGTLYSVFGGKADIEEAVHDERLGELFVLAANTMAGGGTAAERLMLGNRVFIRWLTEHPDFLRIHLYGSGAWATDPREVGEGRVHAWRRGIDLIASVIRQAMDEGDMHDGDAVLAARLMVAMQQVFMSTWVESGMKTQPDELAHQIEQQLERLLMRNRR